MICTRVIHMANGDQDNSEHFIGTSAKCAEESTRTRREVGHRCYWRDLLASSCRSNRSMKTRIASGALLLSRPGMGGFYTNGASDGNAELRKGVPALRTSDLRFRAAKTQRLGKGSFSEIISSGLFGLRTSISRFRSSGSVWNYYSRSQRNFGQRIAKRR